VDWLVLESLKITLKEALEFNQYEIGDILAIKICKDPGIPRIK
jgi:hypothetical protein